MYGENQDAKVAARAAAKAQEKLEEEAAAAAAAAALAERKVRYNPISYTEFYHILCTLVSSPSWMMPNFFFFIVSLGLYELYNRTTTAVLYHRRRTVKPGH